MVPQFQRLSCRFQGSDIAVGLTLFVLGLFKKVVLADGIAEHVAPLYQGAATGRTSFFPSWFAALGFTLQMYFDFSGYSDMAIGLGLMMGFRFVENFNQPYISQSITEFWRRWHMSLSAWLRDYLYIALGGNRGGTGKTYRNLFLTMLLGGLWHGAGWTFIVWGALHGALLCVNHAWFAFRKKMSLPAIPKPLAIGMTARSPRDLSLRPASQAMKAPVNMLREFAPGTTSETPRPDAEGTHFATRAGANRSTTASSAPIASAESTRGMRSSATTVCAGSAGAPSTAAIASRMPISVEPATRLAPMTLAASNSRTANRMVGAGRESTAHCPIKHPAKAPALFGRAAPGKTCA